DAKMERPETRPFKNNPIAMIHRDRGAYLAAIFTIVKAFMASGETVNVENINGLEGWSRFVQQPLVWLKAGDPAKSQEDARARDPQRSALRARITAIVKYFSQVATFSANDVYTKAMALAPGQQGYQQHFLHQDLFDAFAVVGKGSVKSIGWQ